MVLFLGPASWLVAVCVAHVSLVHEFLDFVYSILLLPHKPCASEGMYIYLCSRKLCIVFCGSVPIPRGPLGGNWQGGGLHFSCLYFFVRGGTCLTDPRSLVSRPCLSVFGEVPPACVTYIFYNFISLYIYCINYYS